MKSDAFQLKSIPEFRPPILDRKVLGYLQVEELHQQHERVEALWNDALSLLTPAADWTVLSLHEFMKRLPVAAVKSAALNRWVEGCDSVALLAASIGESLEQRAHTLFDERESFSGYVLDRMGSYLAELWITTLDDHVQDVLEKEGFDYTRRYSPGYAGTPLEMQDVFLEFAQRRIPFLRLSDAHIVLPEKSVFALKGVGGGKRKS
jgi:hypothetical protein